VQSPCILSVSPRVLVSSESCHVLRLLGTNLQVGDKVDVAVRVCGASVAVRVTAVDAGSRAVSSVGAQEEYQVCGVLLRQSLLIWLLVLHAVNQIY
jgi:hypothetical protein